MRGRRPNLKEIEGGLHRVPSPPDGLPKDAIDDWNTVTADLQGRGLLFSASLGLVESYCTALWSVRKCRAAIAEHGPLVRAKDQQLKPNPANAMLRAALDAVARIGAELGLSPSARMRKQFNPEESEDADSLVDF